MATVVDTLYGEFVAIMQMMDKYGAVSFRNTINDNFRKTLLICAASFCEHKITADVIDYCSEVSGGNTLVPFLVRNKAVSRQYHTWFDWNKNTANSFFAMFGDDFKQATSERIRLDGNLASSIADFLELGRERNRLVHQNFGSFSLEKTAEEIFRLYASALLFVEFIPKVLREYSTSTGADVQSS